MMYNIIIPTKLFEFEFFYEHTPFLFLALFPSIAFPTSCLQDLNNKAYTRRDIIDYLKVLSCLEFSTGKIRGEGQTSESETGLESTILQNK